MTTKEKREYIIFGVLVIAIVYVLYTYLFKSNPAPVQVQQITPTAGIPAPGSAPNSPISGIPVIAGQSSAHSPAGFAGQLLPNGAQIDLSILQDPRFQQLVPPAYPKVNSSEIGQVNPFKSQ